ncbi:hypothetical protein HK102_007753, partial [Quaeritorhiza haematococci]
MSGLPSNTHPETHPRRLSASMSMSSESGPQRSGVVNKQQERQPPSYLADFTPPPSPIVGTATRPTLSPPAPTPAHPSSSSSSGSSYLSVPPLSSSATTSNSSSSSSTSSSSSSEPIPISLLRIPTSEDDLVTTLTHLDSLSRELQESSEMAAELIRVDTTTTTITASPDSHFSSSSSSAVWTDVGDIRGAGAGGGGGGGDVVGPVSPPLSPGTLVSMNSNGQIKVLLEQAKRIVFQLKSLVLYNQEFDLTDDGRLPSYDQLVSRLNDAFRHQKEINHMNAKLMSVNYMVNLSNFAKNRQFHKALVQGRKRIQELQATVAVLEDSVDNLNVEVEVQKKTAERLKVSLDNTRGLLEDAMTE